MQCYLRVVLVNFCVLAVGSSSVLSAQAFTISSFFSQAPGGGTPSNPYGTAADSQGNVYFSDSNRAVVMRRSPAGVLAPFAGTGIPGFNSLAGVATSVLLDLPTGLAVDSQDNLYIADTQNRRIRKVTPQGVLSTIAGNGSGFGPFYVDGSLATDCALGPFVTGIGVDSAQNLYIADFHAGKVLRVNPQRVLSFFLMAGPGGSAIAPVAVTVDTANNVYAAISTGIIKKSVSDGTVTTYSAFTLSAFYALAFDPVRGVCYTDSNQVKCVDSFQSTSVVAGTGAAGLGGDGGPALAAMLYNPQGIGFDSSGNLYIADTQNSRLRKVTPSGIISTLTQGPVSAPLRIPKNLATDAAGNLYVADELSHVVWQVSPSGQAVVIAGTGLPGVGGNNILATNSTLFAPRGLAIDSTGNLYITETGSHRVRKITTDGVIHLLAGSGIQGFSGDGGPAANAKLDTPQAVTVDSQGNVFIADTYNNRVRRVTPAGTISTVAGSGPALGFGSSLSAGDGGPAIAAQLNNPSWLAIDSSDRIYVSELSRIRAFYPGGAISTFIGTGGCDPSDDGVTVATASLCGAFGMAFDSVGNMYIADQGRERIRMIDSTGTIFNIAGTGLAGFSGDGGPAIDAQINIPWGIAVDASGNLFISDLGNTRIRKVVGGVRCHLSVSPHALATNSGPFSGTLTLSGAGGCPYTATADSAWMHVNGNAQSTGPNMVPFSIDSNFGSEARTGSIRIATTGASVSFIAYQAGAGCQMSLIPTSAVVSPIGQTGLVQIAQTPLGCASFTVSSDAPWLQYTGAPTYYRSPSAGYLALPNTTPSSRTGYLMINGQSFRVDQSASPVQITSPAPGSTISGTSVTFTWTTGGAMLFRYEVSTSLGSSDITSGLTAGGAASVAIPAGASTIYFRLWPNFGGIWQSIPLDATYSHGVSPPSPVSVAPGSGTGVNQTITFTFQDPRGAQDLGVLNVLVNSFLDGRNACYLAYSQPFNLLYLVNNTGDGLLPGAALSSAGSVSNSQCTVSWTGSPVLASGNTLSLTLSFVFNSSFAGNKVVYLAARDVAENNSGWQALGTWLVPGGPSGVIAVGDMSPARGNGLNQTFTFNFTDTNGFANLGVINILVNDFLDGRQACYLAYSRPFSVLYLVNDNGDGLLPGASLSTGGSLSNSQCSVSWGNSPVVGTGNLFVITLNMGFSAAFRGNRLFYLAARDLNEGNNTDWQPKGSWTVQ